MTETWYIFNKDQYGKQRVTARIVIPKNQQHVNEQQTVKVIHQGDDWFTVALFKRKG